MVDEVRVNEEIISVEGLLLILETESNKAFAILTNCFSVFVTNITSSLLDKVVLGFF